MIAEKERPLRLLVLLLSVFLLTVAMPGRLTSYADTGTAAEAADSAEDANTGDSGDESSANESAFLDSMLDTVFGNMGPEEQNYFAPANLLSEADAIIFHSFSKITGSSIYTLLKGFAVLIMTMYFIMGLSSKDFSTQFGKPTVELISRPFAKYLICLFVVVFMEYLLQFFFSLSHIAYGTAAENSIELMSSQESTVLGADAVKGYKDAIYAAVGYVTKEQKSGLGIVDTFKNIPPFISIIFAFLFPWIISMASDMVTVWVVYSRTVNIVVRAIAAPLAFSDLYSEQPFRETRAFGFLREFAGLCFQSAVIMVTFVALQAVMGVLLEHLPAGSTFGDIQGLALKIGVFKLVQVGVLVGSANTAKRLFGAA